MPPRKRLPKDLASVPEPHLTPGQFDAWCDGVELFNSGAYWNAHERWEEIWKEMGDGPEDDAEIVLRGFIQLAAALHLVGEGRLDGARSNFMKAAEKLRLAPDSFLGISVQPLRSIIPTQLTLLPERAAFVMRSTPSAA
jgi:predicted metal-dependent hydrolase